MHCNHADHKRQQTADGQLTEPLVLGESSATSETAVLSQSGRGCSEAAQLEGHEAAKNFFCGLQSVGGDSSSRQVVQAIPTGLVVDQFVRVNEVEYMTNLPRAVFSCRDMTS